jgi:chromosome segregation protein
MKIKNIYIQGFKSFMDKSNIHFSPGISAFVGPNGCGKSNIVDAIRWVMGEQSPKQLRGRQMEDLIFSGAGSLKPLGMAEVSLTLDNGAESHDISEISVSRRLFRSGESEYLINNTPCRLKDIHDLFLGTGLGNRAYAIIAQGEISSIIDQKPEDTRLLLEEAAGISKYKARREASLRKMALAKENLRRVEDLLIEIKREMNSLKRQAGKARRFKEVSSEIRRLNLVLSAHEYEELRAEKIKREKSSAEIINKEKELEALFSEFENAIEAKNRELMEQERSLSSLKESVFSLREECRKNEDALKHLATDQQRSRHAEMRLNKEREEIKEKVKGYHSEIEKITLRVSELQQSLQEISTLCSRYDATLKDQAEEMDRVKSGLEKDKTNLIELTNKEAGLTGAKRNLLDIINQTEVRKTELEKEYRESAQRREKLADSLREKKERRTQILTGKGTLENTLQARKVEQKRLEGEKSKKESVRSASESELNILRSQLKTIRGLIESYEGYKSGVQTIMKARGSKSVHEGKVLGVLADFMQVEPEFEVAVEAVLDERLQYVVVARQEDGKDAVEYLRSKDVGRSYFLPLEGFKYDKSHGIGKGKGNGFPLLRDHISVPNRFRPIVESFLGNAALADSLSEALYAWNNGRKRQTLVTLEGDLVDEKGIIMGGRLGKDSIGLLRRRREEQGLRNRIEEKEKVIAGLIEELGDIGAQELKVQRAIEQMEIEREGHLKHIEEVDKEILLIENESQQLITHSQYLVDQLGTLNREKDERSSHIAKLEKTLTECRQEKEALQKAISNREAHFKELEAKCNDSRQALSQILIRYNQHKEEERGLLREKERLEQFIHEMDERINNLGEEIQSNRNQIESSLRMEKELKEGLKVISRTQKELETQKEESEQSLDVQRQELREKERETSLLRERISEVRQEINEERIRDAEIDFQMKGILSQINREMGINLERDYTKYLEEDFSRPHCEQQLKGNLRIKERIGEVNLLAINDYEKLKERYEFIKTQEQDLLYSIDSLNTAISRINRVSKAKFLSTLKQADEKLKEIFPILFGGGKARLRLIDEALPLESGVLVEVQPPGKRVVHMGLLSGGEKALAAMALLFAIYLIKPSPFIIMDEVDAPLDEVNTNRFNELLKEIEKSSQVIMVTHNRKTMEQATRLYGVTMDTSNVSKLVSVDLQSYK